MSEQAKRPATAQGRKNSRYIDFVELFYRLLDKWTMILALVLVFGLGAGVYTYFFITPKYKSTSTIYVLTRKDSAINFSDLQLGSALTNDYIVVFDIWEVYKEVVTKLNLPYSYSQIHQMLTVENISGTRMIRISIESPDPKEATDLANEFANASSQFISDIMSTEKPSVVSYAQVPTKPSSPSLTRNIAIGIIFGLNLSVCIVLYQMLNDDKYKTAEDVRKYLDLPTLALVPEEDSSNVSAMGSSYGRRRTKY